MSAATVRAYYFGASATLPAGANCDNADGNSVVFNRVDTQSGTTPVPIPTSAGNNYSYLKVVQLYVTVTGTTTINNRTVRISGSLASGLGMHWKTDTGANWASSFNQQSASKATADSTGANSAGTAPTGYTAVTTSAVQYDNDSIATSSTGIGTTSNHLLALELAVDASYAGGPGSASLGNIILGYDEA